MERSRRTTTLFLMALAAISLYFCYVIAKPFLRPIFLAVMLAVVFDTAHRRIEARVRGQNLAALISTILVIVVLVAPGIGLGITVSREIKSLLTSVSDQRAEQIGLDSQLTFAYDRILGWVGRFVDISQVDVHGAVSGYIEQITRSLLSWGTQAVGGIFSFFVELAIAVFTLFFFFRDGSWIKDRWTAVLPLSSSQIERLFTGISNSIVANVYGCLAVGGAQGSLTGLTFWFLGLPSPVLWGAVTALFSLIPVIGSGGVWGPAVIILILGGHWWKGLFLLGWGIAVIAQIDNLVRPYVIGQRAKLHTLVIFFALLGGVSAFGIFGIFVGPVIVSITAVVVEMLLEVNQKPSLVGSPEILAGKEV